MSRQSTFRALFSASVLMLVGYAMAISAPTINVWYGNTQPFGHLGNPQSAINILGNVSDPSGISNVYYTLNGGSPVSLSRGPDSRRLLRAGDFNIDIFTSTLNNGSNTIVITAVSGSGQTSMQTVTVQYTSGQTWPTNYSINWSSAGSIQSVAQVIDGHWAISNGTVQPTQIGYDRLVGIGDRTWTDYEVTVPITIFAIDSTAIPDITSQGPGIGLLFRWTGHTDNPIPGWQPKTGYLPFGAIAWYKWAPLNAADVRFRLEGNNLNLMQQDNSGFQLTFGVTYIFKMRVETVPGVGGLYKFKVWQQGQSEPSNWRLQGQQSLTDPQAGSPCLLSHHVDATFGNVTITPLGGGGGSTIVASVKAWLQGPYSTSNGNMQTSIRTLCPLTQPYSNSPWFHLGSESVGSIPSNVVDWVLLELRTGTSPATKVATRAAFIKSDGMIVDLDGTSPVSFSGVAAGNYYIVVRHRNHLSIMTASPHGLGQFPVLYDFTTAQSQAYGSLPMVQLSQNVYGLYAGDANASSVISSSDANNVFSVLNASNYNLADINMSGVVSASDANIVFFNLNMASQVP